jgi:glyoxylase-like metal-dependent hydrolase (beta-lactamase superfamily II)
LSRFHRFNLADREIVVLSDGSTAFPSAFLLIGVDEDQRLEACRTYGMDPDAVESNMNCVYLNIGGTKILFDTGAGPTMPGCGNLLASLDAAGISPESIDRVIHTHLHLDHVGSNVDEHGEPVFPNARYYVGQTEWNFWSSEANLAALERAELWNLPEFEPAMAAVARRNVLALGERVEVFPDDGHPAPGVQALPAFGHTPGHLAFKVDLGDEALYITGDLVLSPFHIDHHDWFPAVDLDPATAMESRARIFNRAASERALVSGYHLPFPGIGRVSTGENGWHWLDEFSIEAVGGRR